MDQTYREARIGLVFGNTTHNLQFYSLPLQVYCTNFEVHTDSAEVAIRELVFREPEEEARLSTRHGQRDSHAMQPPNKWPPYLAHTRVAD